MVEFSDFLNRHKTICVVGLGYVGLPLATLLARKYAVTGFDINPVRIEELARNIDRTHEVEPDVLKESNIVFTNRPQKISECALLIVTVPTPIVNDRAHGAIPGSDLGAK